jgi:uncharacterized protein YjbJ (UPF0337 family)
LTKLEDLARGIGAWSLVRDFFVGLSGSRVRRICPFRTFEGERVLMTTQTVEKVMDKDRVEGAVHQVKGAVKETAGKVTGDAKTQAEGAAEKAAGKVQNAVGGAKDAVRDAAKK